MDNLERKTMKKEAVIFDCDGVLINTEEVGYNITSKMLEEAGLKYSREEYVELLSGLSYKEFQKKLRHDFNERAGKPLPDGFEDEITRRLRAAIDTEVKAIEGVKTLLQELKRVGIPFAVASNSGRESLEHKLRVTGLYDYFGPHIYSSDDVENAKPAPDLPLLAAQKLGVAPEKCIGVEDSVTGTTGFVAAGMLTFGFVGEAHRADNEARYLREAGAAAIVDSMDRLSAHISLQTGKFVSCSKPKAPGGPQPG